VILALADRAAADSAADHAADSADHSADRAADSADHAADLAADHAADCAASAADSADLAADLAADPATDHSADHADHAADHADHAADRAADLAADSFFLVGFSNHFRAASIASLGRLSFGNTFSKFFKQSSAAPIETATESFFCHFHTLRIFIFSQHSLSSLITESPLTETSAR
jgi:hypothetical protein